MKLAIERLKIELDILYNNYNVFTKEYRHEEAKNAKLQGMSINKAIKVLEAIDCLKDFLRKKRDMESLSG